MINGMTQTDIAQRLGVHQPQVSLWLSGARMPKSSNLHRLAEVLGIEPAELWSIIDKRRQERLARR